MAQTLLPSKLQENQEDPGSQRMQSVRNAAVAMRIERSVAVTVRLFVGFRIHEVNVGKANCWKGMNRTKSSM